MYVCREPVYDQPDTGYESYSYGTSDNRNYGSGWGLSARTEGSGIFFEEISFSSTFLLNQPGFQERYVYQYVDVTTHEFSSGIFDTESFFADRTRLTTATNSYSIDVGPIGYTGHSEAGGTTSNKQGGTILFTSTASSTGSASVCFIGPMAGYPWVFSEYLVPTTSYIQGIISTSTTTTYSAIFGSYDGTVPTTYTDSLVCDTTTYLTEPMTFTTSTVNQSTGTGSLSFPPFSTTTASSLCPPETTTTVTKDPGTTYNASRVSYVNWTELARVEYRTVYSAQHDGVNEEWLWVASADIGEGAFVFTDAFHSVEAATIDPIDQAISVDEWPLFEDTATKELFLSYMDVSSSAANLTSWGAENGERTHYVPGYLPMEQSVSDYTYDSSQLSATQDYRTAASEATLTGYGVTDGTTHSSIQVDAQRILTHREPNGDAIVSIDSYTSYSSTRDHRELQIMSYGRWGTRESTNDNTAPYDDWGYFYSTESNSTVTFEHPVDTIGVYWLDNTDTKIVAVIPAFTTGFQLVPNVDATADFVFRGLGANVLIPYDQFLGCIVGGDNENGTCSVSAPYVLAGSTTTIFHSIDERTWKFVWTNLPQISVTSYTAVGNSSTFSSSFVDVLYGLEPMQSSPFIQTGMEPFSNITIVGGRQNASFNNARESVYLQGLFRATDNWSNTWYVSETRNPVSFLIENTSAVALSVPMTVNFKTFSGGGFANYVTSFQKYQTT